MQGEECRARRVPPRNRSGVLPRRPNERYVSVRQRARILRVSALLVLAALLVGCPRQNGPAAPATTDGNSEAGESRSTVDSARAVLKAGPRLGRGISFLPANVLDYQRADYAISEGIVLVYYLGGGGQLWEPQSSYQCDGETLTRVRTLEGTAHVHANTLDDGGRLLLLLPEALDDPCVFATPFIRRLRFFRRAAREDPVIPFPAFLDLDR